MAESNGRSIALLAREDFLDFTGIGGLYLSVMYRDGKYAAVGPKKNVVRTSNSIKLPPVFLDPPT
jgi:hypothetical protein